MGNSSSNINFEYAVATNNPDKAVNETQIYRHPHAIGKDIFKLTPAKTLHHMYQERFHKNPNILGFGQRVYNKETNSYSKEIKETTNADFLKDAEEIGSGLIHLNLAPEINEWNNLKLNLFGIYAKHSMEYIKVDIACTLYGITVVPVYDTLGEEATNFAFSQTKMQCCAVTVQHAAAILKMQKTESKFSYLKSLVIFDPQNLTEDLKNREEVNGIRLLKLDDVKEIGRKNIKKWAEVKPESIYAFSYTSGTTGEPKAAMLSHKSMCSIFAVFTDVVKAVESDVHLSYLPMAHVLERTFLNCCLGANVKICMYSGDVMKLKDDLSIFKPTIFASVPRLYNKFYDAIKSGVSHQGTLARFLYNRGLQAKLSGLKRNATCSHRFYDRYIFNKIKLVLGGNVRLMMTGSAPISEEVIDFLQVNFGAPIIEDYGQTETNGVAFLTSIDDPESGHVGGPAIMNEFKLVDIPDMKYFSTDVDESGNPTPRGEIWVRGPNIIPGYYKQDEKNAETFTEDGWMKSGDCGMIYSDKRRMKIIDRLKNIFKLAQGEYIAPEKLENVYKQAHGSISAIYVYGDSLQSVLIAVINVEGPNLAKFAKEFGIKEESFEKLAENLNVKKKYIELFDIIAQGKKLNSLEKLKDVHIETKTFQELGLLTEAMKVKRVDIKNFYKKTFDEMYEKMN